jgi:hypothetical protein
MDVGKEREHDCTDAGGRATQGAVAEERKLFRQIWIVFAGNTSFRCRSNWLIPAYGIPHVEISG